MALLTTAQIENAKSWIADLMVMTGLYTDVRDDNYCGSYKSNEFRYNREMYQKAAQNVYKEITNKNFNNIDDDLRRLSNLYFGEYFKSKAGETIPLIRKSPEMLAKYLAWLCASKDILWDDTIRSPEELADFRSSIFGRALEAANLFVSQPEKPTRLPSISSTSSKVYTYKSDGPMSSKVRDLKGTAGKNEHPSTSRMFTIIGKSATATAEAYAFIKPILDTGAKGTTNKVFIGRDSGFSYCACWFTTPEEADAFLVKCKEIVPEKVTDLHVAWKYTDKNGYYRVGTEFGDCYIKASKLNEYEPGFGPRKKPVAESYDTATEMDEFDAMIEAVQHLPQTDIIKDIKAYNKIPNSWEN